MCCWMLKACCSLGVVEHMSLWAIHLLCVVNWLHPDQTDFLSLFLWLHFRLHFGFCQAAAWAPVLLAQNELHCSLFFTFLALCFSPLEWGVNTPCCSANLLAKANSITLCCPCLLFFVWAPWNKGNPAPDGYLPLANTSTHTLVSTYREIAWFPAVHCFFHSHIIHFLRLLSTFFVFRRIDWVFWKNLWGVSWSIFIINPHTMEWSCLIQLLVCASNYCSTMF